MPTPRDSDFSMPPEWARHERTWMELPPANDTFGDGTVAVLLQQLASFGYRPGAQVIKRS